MRKLVYVVAATIDGFIAGPGGEIDFFPIEPDVMAAMNTEQPEMVPTQFRAAAGLTDAPNRRFDTVIMGRRSYEVVLKEGITSPYTHLEQYVFSRTLTSTDPAVTVVSRDPAAFVRELKRRDGLDLWLCGGGGLAGTLMPEIDELQVKRYPLAIGTGTPMFDHTFAVTAFTVTGTRSFGSGAIVVTYRRPEPAEPRPGNRGPAPPTARFEPALDLTSGNSATA